MTTKRSRPRYVDHLWYPILVKMREGHQIMEMQGKQVNAWNDMVKQQWYEDIKIYSRGWLI